MPEDHTNPEEIEEEIFDVLEMNEEQEKLFDSMTPLQKKFSVNYINGRSKKQAYFGAGGKAKNPDSVRNTICRMFTNCYVSEFITQMKKKAAEIQLCTAVDIAAALMREAGVKRNRSGQHIAPPEDSTQTARVSALKALTEYTGGFDKNTQKHEITEFIDPPDSDFYDDE